MTDEANQQSTSNTESTEDVAEQQPVAEQQQSADSAAATEQRQETSPAVKAPDDAAQHAGGETGDPLGGEAGDPSATADSSAEVAASEVSDAADEVSRPDNEVPRPADEDSASADNGAPKITPRREIKIGSQRDASVVEQLKARPQPLGSGHDVTGPPPASTDHLPRTAERASASTAPPVHFPPPRLEPKMSADMQQELDAALGGVSIDELMATGSQPGATEELVDGARVTGRVLSASGENVFVELGLRHQGVVAAKQFAEQLPEPGSELTALVSRFDAEEGIYELVLADSAVDVSAWEEISEGIVVDAVITGHNKGGLECEVNRLRGFIPMSQISLYRVDDVEEYVGQRFACVVTEVKPERRNLVLSRRSMLERQQAEEKKRLLEELEVGQIREGVVRRLQPFGAFVDLGGVDGLIHISQLSWDRVNDPSEVLEVGQTIKVKVNKINPETGKIGLGYRETFENPWSKAAEKYKPKERVTGTVSRLMDFGAFVKLEPGVEGLIHISELAYKRVFRAADVVSEGQEVEVMVLSVDAPNQRIALSLKALQEKPVRESQKKDDDRADAEFAQAQQSRRKKAEDPNLRGGINRHSDGQQFGLKW
jgi:small subunit ribosomal protein S1